MGGDLVSTVRRYHAALDMRDFAAIAAMFAPDACYVSPGVGGRIEGRARIIAAFERYFAEYADQRADDDDISLIAPCTVRALWRLTATSSAGAGRSDRRGEEHVTFSADGLIRRIEVTDS